MITGQYSMMTAELPNENVTETPFLKRTIIIKTIQFEKKACYNGKEISPTETSDDERKELMQKLKNKEELNEELQRTVIVVET